MQFPSHGITSGREGNGSWSNDVVLLAPNAAMPTPRPNDSLDTILITDDLAGRAARRPNISAENAAYQSWARLLATQPVALLPALVHDALALCHADTAGVSVTAQSENGDDLFRWKALAGTLAAHGGGTTPRHLSPGDVTLECLSPQLFDRPGRVFAYLDQLPVPIVEALIVPLANSAPAGGTFWIITHDDNRHFDVEDLRVLTTLAAFAVAALELTQNAHARARRSHEAREAVRLRDEVIATLCHDLRNPLTVIKGQTQLLHRQLARPNPPPIESVDARLVGIEQAADRIAQQIGELADVTLLSSGHPLVLHPQAMDLVALTRALVRAYQGGTERHAFRCDCHDAELRGVWDRARLGRCLDNVLSNAVKFSPDGGPIIITLARDDGWAIVDVTDHGVGIPAVDQQRVFERFFRARNVQEQFDGSGLGLRGVRDIIKAHEGSVELQSVEGVGTTVTFRLPLPTDVQASMHVGAESVIRSIRTDDRAGTSAR